MVVILAVCGQLLRIKIRKLKFMAAELEYLFIREVTLEFMNTVFLRYGRVNALLLN